MHKCQVVKDALAALEAANVHLFYLPAYSPELSRIEPVWKDVKHHGMPTRSYTLAGDLKRGVDVALQEKAQRLRLAYAVRAAEPEANTDMHSDPVQTKPVCVESDHSLVRAA
ncbi:MAG: transposase [Armatimonadetes bacterium]|nr:transposase [Armatimonadota bacterium]